MKRRRWLGHNQKITIRKKIKISMPRMVISPHEDDSYTKRIILPLILTIISLLWTV